MDGVGTAFWPMLGPARIALADHLGAEASSDCESPAIALLAT